MQSPRADRDVEALSSQPIGVIVSTAGDAFVQSGETFELSVIVSNKGNESAVFDIFLDDLPAIAHPWCKSTQTRLALAPGQGEEVVFEFSVPPAALSGTYRYWLVVDAPNHYRDTPPLRYEQTLQVLPPTRNTRRENDPTFALEPATSSSKPIKATPGMPLQFQVHVYNRADRVDRFRLVCTDLPEGWVRVDYPQGFQMPGLTVQEPHLNLNPDAEGVILLTITPPADVLAKTILATLQLKSENNPALKLLEAVYLQVKPIYQVEAHFRTLVSRVQNQPGLYSVEATNKGNTDRQLAVELQGLKRGEKYAHTITPETLLLAPGQTLTSEISVQPKSKWKRPIFGGPKLANFEVVVSDIENKPLPKFPMPGLLTWETRPWWQVFPFILLLLGSVVGLIFLTWWFFIRPPAPANILRIAPEATGYEASRGDAVHLGFEIANPQRIQRLEIVGQSAEGDLLSGPIVFDLSKGLPPKLEEACVWRRRLLTCRNVRTDARRSAEYVFTLTAVPKPGRNAQTVTASSLPVAIAPVPLPEITAIAPTSPIYAEAPPDAEDKSEYMARLNWTIDHPDQLSSLRLVAKDAEGAPVTEELVFDVSQELPDSLAQHCNLAAQLVCQNVPTSLTQAGNYTFELTAIPKGAAADTPVVATSEAVDIQARPPRLLTFTLNGEAAGAKHLIPISAGGAPVNLALAWKVEDNAGTQVMLLPAPGDVGTEGSLTLPLPPEPGETVVSLQVTNSAGEQLIRSVTITTYNPNPQDPTIVVNTGESGADAAGDATGGGGAGAQGSAPSVGVPVPSRPGTVSPQELPPQFE